MTTPDPIRALLIEMTDELDHSRQCLMDDRRLTHPLADRARAALAAAPEGEVGEFIAQLKSYAEYGTPIRLIPFVVLRAATLLEQLSAAAPAVVPVSERLPAMVTDGLRVAGDCDEQVEELCEEHCFNVEGYESIECLQGLINDALARWGRPAAPPAPLEGEVGELAAKLRRLAPQNPLGTADPTITRAAELLQRQQAKIESLEQQLETERMRVAACGIIATSDTPFSAAKNRNCHPDYWSASADDIARQIDELMRLRAQQTPVPVSERLPGPGDCDEEGLCWWFSPADPSAGTFGVAACWVLRKHEPEDDFRTHWLPVHALPLPSGEVER